MSEEVDDAVWRELRRLEDRTTAAERLLDRHLGQCEERHKEIIRRQEDSTRDRSQMRVDIAAASERTNAAVDKLRGWVTGLVLTVAGAAITGALGVIGKLMKVY